MNLFNKNFFRLTLGFLSILLLSFALTAVVTHLDTRSQAARAVGN